MSFLGHVISSSGIVVDSSKIDVVLHWEDPKLVTKIRSFWAWRLFEYVTYILEIIICC